MNFTEISLRNFRITPYYRRLAIENQPIVTAASGLYRRGNLLNWEYHQLTIDSDGSNIGIRIGQSYACSAQTADGNREDVHWLYCTAIFPKIELGLIRNWQRPESVSPILPSMGGPFVYLEEIQDIAVIYPSPSQSIGVSQARLGQRGSLVSVPVTSPPLMGVIIDNPSPPSSLTLGSDGISISATVQRTMQSVGFSSLSCVWSDEQSLCLLGER